MVKSVAKSDYEIIEETGNYFKDKKLPKPEDIPVFIKAYYYLMKNSDDTIKKVSQETIDSLEDLIRYSNGPDKTYLILYNQTAVNISERKYKLEEKYDKRIVELTKARDTLMSEIKNKVKGNKKGIERWFSIGVGSIFSYFFGNFVVEYLNIPKEYSGDASAAAIFGLIGLLSMGLHKYYSHESVRVLEKFNKKMDALEEERTYKVRNLYKRGELLARMYYSIHIGGKLKIKKTVDKIAKEDGTKYSFMKNMFNSFVSLVR